jgi:hypothetical protein
MMELMDDMQWRFLDNPKILVPPLTPDWAYVVGREKPLGYSISLRTISLRVFNNNDDEHIHVIEIFVVHFFLFFSGSWTNRHVGCFLRGVIKNATPSSARC